MEPCSKKAHMTLRICSFFYLSYKLPRTQLTPFRGVTLQFYGLNLPNIWVHLSSRFTPSNRDLDGFFSYSWWTNALALFFFATQKMKNRLVKLDPIHAQTLRGQKKTECMKPPPSISQMLNVWNIYEYLISIYLHVP